MLDQNEINSKSTKDFIQHSQKLQKSIEEIREKMHNTCVVGLGGDGFVKIKIRVGDYRVEKVELEQEIMQMPKEYVESCISTAFRDAIRKSEEIIEGNNHLFTSI